MKSITINLSVYEVQALKTVKNYYSEPYHKLLDLSDLSCGDEIPQRKHITGDKQKNIHCK